MSHRIFDTMMIDGHMADTSRLKDTGKVYFGDEEWDADELITDEDKLQVFKEDSLLTKGDILSDIDFFLKKINEDSKEDTKRSAAFYTKYLDLMNRFKEKVEKSTFPEKLEDWWHYEYDVKETGITLMLAHVESYDLDEDGNPDLIWEDTVFDLFQVKTEMMTVEQYAQTYGVTTTTVRQWIRRGKLRTAVKQGNEWRIPSLAEVGERGYRFVQYCRDEYIVDYPEGYSFINDYSTISIEQKREHKDMFLVSFSGKDREDKLIEMNTQEREKFELFLIANPFITPVTSGIMSRG